MGVLKAMTLAAVLTWAIALVVGSQGSSGGSLAVHSMHIVDFKMYWSWPLFLSATGLSWGLILLQR
ncbi:hypothetical protein [Erythrobacter sp. JK5]|uniref:hypothetical protein n=1 Tax=Erythrobacter sp. JK5 TaxID=2829500 RepID=UPI001BA78FB3|nr:hypothetical protein [Erythrobacter sp. JK5]QUL37251.1 hypothetical protein KDC96_12840 [Erythrobacter sp. JK5]